MAATPVAVIGDHLNSSVLITPEASTTRLKSTDDSDLAVEPPQGDCQVAHSPREHFPQPAVIVPAKFEPLVGPLSPAPNLTLADAISRMVAADERWYALNDGWVA